MSPEKCHTGFCKLPAAVPGYFRFTDDDAGSYVSYCRGCATHLWIDGCFTPDNLAELQGAAPELTAKEAATLARFEAAPPAPESFDAHAAIRRVMKVAEHLQRHSLLLPEPESKGYRRAAEAIREAVGGVTA